MAALPWKFLVVTEAGAETARPVRVAPGGADGWLEALGAAVDLPAAGGAPAARVPLATPGAFGPDALRSALGGSPPAAGLDAALHHPGLQRVESAWRGLRLLMEHAGDGIEVEVLCVPRKNLAVRFRESVFEPFLRGGPPLSLILADFDFTHTPSDLALLADLAGMAKVMQAPIVAQAGAGFFELRYLVQVVALPELLPRLSGAAHTPWRAFQASEPARWVALTLNRWLQRAPYSESQGHAETVSESNPDSYLWGRGVWMVGAAAARSVRAHGHALDVAGAQGGGFKGPATRPYATGANTTAPLGVEVPFTEMQLLELSRAAFTTLIGPLRSDMVMMPMVVTVFRLHPGKITVEGTLAYQLFAGRLAHFCGQLLDQAPATGANSTADYFRRELRGFLGTLAGESPEEAVSVELREVTEGDQKRTMAEVHVKPAITLEGKRPEFEFMLPVG
jgi:predicted component of type VI protein secretion system